MYGAIRSTNMTTTKTWPINEIVVISFAVLKKYYIDFKKIIKCNLWDLIYLEKKNLKSLDLQKIHKNKLEFVFDGDESKQTDTWCVIHVNKDYLISGWNSKASGIKSKQTTQVKVWKADDVYPPSSLLIIPPKFKEIWNAKKPPSEIHSNQIYDRQKPYAFLYKSPGTIHGEL